MLRDILVGSSVCVLNIVIHAWLTVATIRVARVLAERQTVHPWRPLVAIMMAAGRADGIDERHHVVRLVDGGHLRSDAKDDCRAPGLRVGVQTLEIERR